jgi:hypothetical protein
MDNQIKKIDENQERILEKLDTLQHLGNEHKESYLTLEEIVKEQVIQNELKHEGTLPTKDDSDKISLHESDLESDTEQETNVQVTTCVNLILSDSILQRIQPKTFSPNEKTVKRYIRGGAKTCTSFIEKNGII